MDDEIPPRLPPRYSSLPRRTKANGHASINQWTYEQSEAGPSSTLNAPVVPQPFIRDYQHQSSSRSFANQPNQSNIQPAADSRPYRMGNEQSSTVGGTEGREEPRDWLPDHLDAQQRRADQNGSGRPPPSTIRRTELELAAEHSVLPEGPQVREKKKKKSLTNRFGSFISYTIRTFVSVINGTSAAERRAKEQNRAQPPKRTQSLIRIDTRSDEVPHQRSQSVRKPNKREEQIFEEMPRQPLRKVRRDQAALNHHANNALNVDGGLENHGNTCYLASAIQALRPVVKSVAIGDFGNTENTEDILAIQDLFRAIQTGTNGDFAHSFHRFVIVFWRMRENRGEQDDASLCLLDILNCICEKTKSPLRVPTREEMQGLPKYEQDYYIKRAVDNSPFFNLIVTTTMTWTKCLICNNNTVNLVNDTVIPITIPMGFLEVEDKYPYIHGSYARMINGRCLTVRVHLSRSTPSVRKAFYIAEEKCSSLAKQINGDSPAHLQALQTLAENRYNGMPDPLIGELKRQMYDTELIEPFELPRTMVFAHGRSGWDPLGRSDATIVRDRWNEFMVAVEIPKVNPGRIAVLIAYGGTNNLDGGPIVLDIDMSATYQDIRKMLKDYLAAYHPFNPDIIIRKELGIRNADLPDEMKFVEGSLADCPMVIHNMEVLRKHYPHLPLFIRICAHYDTSAAPIDVNFDHVAIHRSCIRQKTGKKDTFRMDVHYILKSHFRETKVDWRCQKDHTTHSRQNSSIYNPAEFLVFCIKRVTHDITGKLAYKVEGEVHVNHLIDLSSIYRQDWHDPMADFVAPRSRPCSMMYEIVSVISHEGGSYTAGHYFAYQYNSATKLFTKYNDLNVTPATESEVNSNPFVLIYRRKPKATFDDIGYGIVRPALDWETVHREAARKAERADMESDGLRMMPNIPNRRSHVKFDNTMPRYHPGRAPADLRSSKKRKADENKKNNKK